MKVSNVTTPSPVETTSTRSKRAGGKDEPRESVSVNVSTSARWLADVKDAAAELDDLDPALVAGAEHDIADGELERKADWDGVLDSLIMEL